MLNRTVRCFYTPPHASSPPMGARHFILLLAAAACACDAARLVQRPARASAQESLCRLRGGAVERTYAMIKPDVAGNGRAVKHIRQLIDEAGLTIVREERCRLSKAECEAFYAEHSERPFFPSLVKFMTSGAIVKLDLEGERVANLLGDLPDLTHTQPKPK